MSKRELDELRDRIEQLFVDSVAGKLEGKSIPIGSLTESGRIFLSKLSGLDFKNEIKFCIHPDDLIHIYKGHIEENEDDSQDLLSYKKGRIPKCNETPRTDVRNVWGNPFCCKYTNSFGIQIIMSNFNSISAVLGLVALGAMTSCSIKEDVSSCPKQQVYVDLRAFDLSMGEFGPVSGGPSTKAVEASEAVSQIAFKAFDASGAEAYSVSQSSGDTGFGALEFELAPGSYTFVAVGNKLGANAGADAMVSISSTSEATLPEALPTDVFSLTKSVTIEPRKAFTTAMTLPRVMSQFKLVTQDILPANVTTLEIIGNSGDQAAGSGASSGASAGASFDPSDGRLLTDQQWVKTANVSASAGKKSINITLNMLLTSDEQAMDVVVNAYDADGALITTLTLEDVPMKRNRVTTARGVLFNAGGSSSFTFENSWLDPWEVTF